MIVKKNNFVVKALIFTIAFGHLTSIFEAYNVYADTVETPKSHEIENHLEPINDFIPEVSIVTLSDAEVESMVEELAAIYPTLPKEYLRETIYKQMRGDYSISPLSVSGFRSSWQGITVEQMGAALDTAIGLAIGGGIGALASAGKSAGRSAMRSAIARLLGYWAIKDVVLDFALNLTSPGLYLAQQWDAHDAVPNNGRINFENQAGYKPG